MTSPPGPGFLRMSLTPQIDLRITIGIKHLLLISHYKVHINIFTAIDDEHCAIDKHLIFSKICISDENQVDEKDLHI